MVNKNRENEKDEIEHLLDVVIESDEKVHTHCVRCGEKFEDDIDEITPENKRVYCNKCLIKMWGPIDQ